MAISSDGQNQGIYELDDFCLRSLHALINIEKGRQTRPLAIETLARVDVGLFRDPQGRLSYWVNEVTRPPWCAQMLHISRNCGALERTAVSLKEGLLSSYDQYRQMYP
jgi:hypothetical protein